MYWSRDLTYGMRNGWNPTEEYHGLIILLVTTQDSTGLLFIEHL